MVNNDRNQERFVNVKELAEFLAVPNSWVYQHTADGDIPHKRVGRYVRFWLPDVLVWLDGEAR